MPSFPGLIQRDYRWSVWKGVQQTKTLIYQHEESDDRYLIWGYDGPEVHTCIIWKGTVPNHAVRDGYTQNGNNSDLAEWEADYKPSSNWPLAKRFQDGRLVMRLSAAIPGRPYHLRAMSFNSSAPSFLHNHKPDGTSYGDVIIKEYDVNGDELTTDFTTSVKTVIDFESLENLEILGGWIEIDSTIAGSSMGAWYLSVIGAPDVAAQYGGSIDFLSEADLSLIKNSQIRMDGRSTHPLTYDPVYHSGKLRVILKHPAGAVKSFQMFLEVFK